MDVRNAEKEFTAIEPAAIDAVECLEAVSRDYLGLRALIIRRVGDPQLAADILQDAAVTTLEKLRQGKIARPGSIGDICTGGSQSHAQSSTQR